MIYVAQITAEQAQFLIGKTFDGFQFFNPIRDSNENWFISAEEVDKCTTIEWVKELVADIVYTPPMPKNPSL